jgi:hypothetical protein
MKIEDLSSDSFSKNQQCHLALEASCLLPEREAKLCFKVPCQWKNPESTALLPRAQWDGLIVWDLSHQCSYGDMKWDAESKDTVLKKKKNHILG